VTAFGKVYFTYVIVIVDLIIDDMKRTYDKAFKEPSLNEPGPTTSPSTLITSATDLMSSILASDPIASAQVTAGVSTAHDFYAGFGDERCSSYCP